MKIALICLVVCLVCLVEVDSRSSRLAHFLAKLGRKKINVNKVQADLYAKLKQRLRQLVSYHHDKNSSDEDDTTDDDTPTDTNNDCNDESLKMKYSGVIKATCRHNDYYCNQFLIRYTKPLYDCQDARKAIHLLITRLGCEEMKYRTTLICGTKSKRACYYAKQLVDFCDHGTGCESSTSTTSTTTTTTTTTTTSPTTSQTTSPTTSPSTSPTNNAPSKTALFFDQTCFEINAVCRPSCAPNETPVEDFTCINGDFCCL